MCSTHPITEKFDVEISDCIVLILQWNIKERKKLDFQTFPLMCLHICLNSYRIKVTAKMNTVPISCKQKNIVCTICHVTF